MARDDEERQPLLGSAAEAGNGHAKHTEDGEPIKTGVGKELWIIARSSIPVALAYCLQNSLQTLSVVVVGRLGPAELSAAAFAYMWAMVTAWCVALGGSTALDTLASSLFTASKNPQDVGVLLQRCVMILTLLYIPFGVMWWFMHPVLLALGQREQLAQDVQAFLRVLSFGAPGYIYFESVKKYLQAQGIMHASTLVLLVVSPLNVLLNYLFVHRTTLGLLGAAFATSISYWLAFFLLVLYARFINGWQCWGGWSRRAFKNWGVFLWLAIPGILHLGTEWVAFEIVALVAGRLGELPLAAQSVIQTADQVMNTFPLGIGVAATARVGNILGARQPAQARRSSNLAVVFASIVGCIIMIILVASRTKFGYLFSDDDDTVRLVAKVLPYVAAFQIFDGWAQSCGGILRGMGRQHIGMMVNLVAYYCLALPLGIALAFKTSQGLAGLWIGQCVALGLVGVGQYIYVYFAKWDKEVDRAMARIQEDQAAAVNGAPS